MSLHVFCEDVEGHCLGMRDTIVNYGVAQII